MDIMLDLETWGTGPGCAIRSIGACVFDPITGLIGKTFYVNVSTQSCLDVGLKAEAGTVDWWSKQSHEAQAALEVNPVPIGTALQALTNFLNQLGPEEKFMWAQGSAFDFPVIEYAMKAVYHPIPWKFWNVFDTRTAYRLYGFDPKKVKRSGTYHNALDDCLHQVKCLHAAWAQGRPAVITPESATDDEDDFSALMGAVNG